MKSLLILLITTAFSFSAHAQIKEYSADDIMRRTSSTDTIYIVNFWATWCAPCVAELPEFNALENHFTGMPVKVLLVSLDFKEDHTFKLARFLELKHIKPEVVWLKDTNPNDFIPKIENSWEGSIPATMVLCPKKHFKKFLEGTVTEQQVGSIANDQL